MRIWQRLTGWVRSWRVRTKLAALVSLLLGGIAAFIFIYFPTRFADEAIEEMRARAASIGEMAAFSVAPGLFFGDSVTVHEALQAPRQNPDVVYLVVLDTAGREFAAVNRAQAPAEFAAPGARNAFLRGGLLYNEAVPVVSNGRPI